MIPLSVRTSCPVGSIRANMVLILFTIVSRFSGGKQKAAIVEFVFEMFEQAQQFVPFGRAAVLETRAGPLRRAGKLAAERMRVGELAPFVGKQQHRLRQVQRGEVRIDGRGYNDVGGGDIRLFQPRPLLAEQDAAAPASRVSLEHSGRGAVRREHRLGQEAASGRCRGDEVQIGNCRGERAVDRGIVHDRHRKCCRIAAASFWQPSRGATRRRSCKPKLAIARAAAPMFSPSCGSTSTIAGPAGPGASPALRPSGFVERVLFFFMAYMVCCISQFGQAGTP